MAKSTKTDAQKREALRAKIAAAETRQQQRSLTDHAKDAADGALAFVKANPLKSVAAVAAGALVIGALTRPGRRAGRKAGAFASAASEAAMAYALGLFEAAGEAAGKGQNRLSDLGETVGARARSWGSAGARETADLSDYLLRAAKRGGKRTGKTIDDLRRRITH